MYAYSCKVRLGGSVQNEVLKPNISAPELLLLRHVHGDDAIVDVKVISTTYPGDNAPERMRLGALYGDKAVVEVLGQGHTKLPDKVAGVTKNAVEESAADALA